MTQSLTKAGNCHRIAVAVDDFDGAFAAWQRLFGAGVMLDPFVEEHDASQMAMVWMGNVPLLALAPTDDTGVLARYIRRNGPSVQSLAWEIDDMWGTDHRLQEAGYTITGVHIAGRHFFVHPRDTFGLLIEFTDDVLPRDPRRSSDGAATNEGGVLGVEGVARVTAAVPDLDAVEVLVDAMFGEPFRRIDAGSQDSAAEVKLGDLVVRFVQPTGEQSRFAALTANGLGRLASVGLAVRNFDVIDQTLEQAGLMAAGRDESSVWLDPAGTQGVQFELVAASIGSSAAG